MGTHNIYFYVEMEKIISELSSNNTTYLFLCVCGKIRKILI